jgi:hypothetical protein
MRLIELIGLIFGKLIRSIRLIWPNPRKPDHARHATF